MYAFALFVFKSIQPKSPSDYDTGGSSLKSTDV